MQNLNEEEAGALQLSMQQPILSSRKGLRQAKNISDKLGKARITSQKTKKASIDILATVMHKAVHGEVELHYKKKEPKEALLLLFLIDSSGSMIKHKQIAKVKGMVNKTIADYKVKNIRFALIALKNGSANIDCYPTTDLEIIFEAVENLQSGGKTAMGQGIALSVDLIKNYLEKFLQANIIQFIFTDGKFNQGGENPFQEAVELYKKELIPFNLKTVVINTETEFVKLNLAGKFANAIGADCQNLN